MKSISYKSRLTREYFNRKYNKVKKTQNLISFPNNNKLDYLKIQKIRSNNRLYGKLYDLQKPRWLFKKKFFVKFKFLNNRSFIPEIGYNKRRGQLTSKILYNNHAFMANWHGISRFRFLGTFRESLGIQLRKMKSFFFSPLNMQKSFRKKRRFSDFLKKKLNLLRMRLFYGIFYHNRYFKFLHDRAKSNDYQIYLYSLMERRLDVLLFRIGFVTSIYLAQQMVRHGKIMIGKRIVRNFYVFVKFFEKVYFSSKEIEDEMRFVFFLKLTKGKLIKLPSYLIFDFNFFFFTCVQFKICLRLNYLLIYHTGFYL